MPPTKKERGRARRAAKKASATSRSGNDQNAASERNCDHLDIGTNWQQNDYDLATELADSFQSKFEAVVFSGDKDDHRVFRKVFRVTLDIYDIYFDFSDLGKELFRQIIIGRGTEVLVNQSKQTDLTKESGVRGIFHHVLMLKTIEVRDGYDGDLNTKIIGEIHKHFNNTSSPRETVRLFHRQNSCDCLKELYYKLKENTKRTTSCWNCLERVDIREISECQCKVAYYCSYDCALAYWPEHKQYCEQFRTSNGTAENGTEKVH
eukprot:scaffold52187_cov35-Cyclotella_meneghiniana.AAC.2